VKAVTHARLTTAVVVAAAGMAGGHLLWPHAPGASPARGAAFYALMLAVGALRGWREARVRADWAPPGARPARPVGTAAAAGAYAVGAALLAALAYRLVHGR
jgi:hypothetical protein